MAQEIVGRAIRLISGQTEQGDGLRLLPFPDVFCTGSFAVQFFAQNFPSGAIVYPQDQQIEERKKKRRKGQPGAGDPEKQEPSRMLARRKKRLKKGGAKKDHEHGDDESNEHRPASRRLIAD